jgi:phage/plasmid-associated DNA primase
VANLNDKRFVLASEPDANRNICGSTLKEITGAPYLNTRGLYSDVCKIVLSLSLVIECNTLLKVDEINEAITRRVRVIPFKSKFITEDKYNELDETEKLGYYVGNAYYKTEEFKQSIRQALFIILKDCFQSVFIDNQIKLPVEPESCKKKTIEYLSTSDDIYTWFSEIYERSNDNNILYFEDIYDTFITSEYYSNLSKLDKRRNNKKNFYGKVEDNIFLKKYIKLRNQKIGNIKLSKDAVVGWKLITTDENECEGEEETKMM